MSQIFPRSRQEKDLQNKKMQEYYNKNIKKWLLKQARERAKEKGIPCTVTDKDFEVPELCPVTLRPMARATKQVSPDSFTLDRLDSTKGYEPGNVMVMSFMANNAKNRLTLAQLRRLVKILEDHNVGEDA